MGGQLSRRLLVDVSGTALCSLAEHLEGGRRKPPIADADVAFPTEPTDYLQVWRVKEVVDPSAPESSSRRVHDEPIPLLSPDRTAFATPCLDSKEVYTILHIRCEASGQRRGVSGAGAACGVGGDLARVLEESETNLWAWQHSDSPYSRPSPSPSPASSCSAPTSVSRVIRCDCFSWIGTHAPVQVECHGDFLAMKLQQVLVDWGLFKRYWCDFAASFVLLPPSPDAASVTPLHTTYGALASRNLLLHNLSSPHPVNLATHDDDDAMRTCTSGRGAGVALDTDRTIARPSLGPPPPASGQVCVRYEELGRELYSMERPPQAVAVVDQGVHLTPSTAPAQTHKGAPDERVAMDVDVTAQPAPRIVAGGPSIPPTPPPPPASSPEPIPVSFPPHRIPCVSPPSVPSVPFRPPGLNLQPVLERRADKDSNKADTHPPLSATSSDASSAFQTPGRDKEALVVGEHQHQHHPAAEPAAPYVAAPVLTRGGGKKPVVPAVMPRLNLAGLTGVKPKISPRPAGAQPTAGASLGGGGGDVSRRKGSSRQGRHRADETSAPVSADIMDTDMAERAPVSARKGAPSGSAPSGRGRGVGIPPLGLANIAPPAGASAASGGVARGRGRPAGVPVVPPLTSGMQKGRQVVPKLSIPQQLISKDHTPGEENAGMGPAHPQMHRTRMADSSTMPPVARRPPPLELSGMILSPRVPPVAIPNIGGGGGAPVAAGVAAGGGGGGVVSSQSGVRSDGGAEKRRLEVETEADEYEETDSLRKRRLLNEYRTKCSPIIPGELYVAGYGVASSEALLDGEGITHIINSAGDVCDSPFPHKYEYLTYYLKDTKTEEISVLFYKTMQWIHDAIDGGGRVLIHCREGVSRSATLATAYLMWRRKWPFETAYNAVRDCRPICNPNTGFTYQLILLGKRLNSNADKGSPPHPQLHERHPNGASATPPPPQVNGTNSTSTGTSTSLAPQAPPAMPLLTTTSTADFRARVFRVAPHGPKDPSLVLWPVPLSSCAQPMAASAHGVAALDPRFVFVILRGSQMVVWVGSECPNVDEAMDGVRQFEGHLKLFEGIPCVDGHEYVQGEEGPLFWSLLDLDLLSPTAQTQPAQAGMAPNGRGGDTDMADATSPPPLIPTTVSPATRLPPDQWPPTRRPENDEAYRLVLDELNRQSRSVSSPSVSLRGNPTPRGEYTHRSMAPSPRLPPNQLFKHPDLEHELEMYDSDDLDDRGLFILAQYERQHVPLPPPPKPDNEEPPAAAATGSSVLEPPSSTRDREKRVANSAGSARTNPTPRSPLPSAREGSEGEGEGREQRPGYRLVVWVWVGKDSGYGEAEDDRGDEGVPKDIADIVDKFAGIRGVVVKEDDIHLQYQGDEDEDFFDLFDDG
ncbi:unnamed protein product [Vitrella brassicaformis CCMP3155]|uniref:Protein-serine/threonine phosphatase n=2 Tax=Vitrella brassicaformis TaxID=1169539 RepID=A0A0G4G7N6_VITBC|nr:unnamed protein product [Vitrella brassicaformis CCMP3155]|eukprot:CEM24715.1 unnamed protein product [Vitrella brassicaformis CCMP3155]